MCTEKYVGIFQWHKFIFRSFYLFLQKQFVITYLIWLLCPEITLQFVHILNHKKPFTINWIQFRTHAPWTIIVCRINLEPQALYRKGKYNSTHPCPRSGITRIQIPHPLSFVPFSPVPGNSARVRSRSPRDWEDVSEVAGYYPVGECGDARGNQNIGLKLGDEEFSHNCVKKWNFSIQCRGNTQVAATCRGFEGKHCGLLFSWENKGCIGGKGGLRLVV